METKSAQNYETVVQQEREQVALQTRRRMYEIPGGGPISEVDEKRYLSTVERVRQSLPQMFLEGLDQSDPELRLQAGKLVRLLSPEQQTALQPEIMKRIETGQQSDDVYDELIAAEFIQAAPAEQRVRLFEQTWASPHRGVRRVALRTIPRLPISERGRFLQAALQDEFMIPMEAAQCLQLVPEPEKSALITQAFQHPVEEVHLGAMKAALQLPESQRRAFVERGITDADLSVCAMAIRQLNPMDVERLLPQVEAGLIRMVQAGDHQECRAGLQLIERLPVQAQTRFRSWLSTLVRARLHRVDRMATLELIAHTSSEDQVELLRLFEQQRGQIKADLRSLAKSTPLYTSAPETFLRAPFEKTGSKTTLLAGRTIDVENDPERTLKHRVILRHLSIQAFETWRQAFEAYGFWQEQGFDYVPVEPIVRVRNDAKKPLEVVVATRVLGPSVSMWLKQTTLFYKEIFDQMFRIDQAIKALGVGHGHPHFGNHCLVFERTSKGDVDLSRPPRVYLIDFDEAISTGT